VAAWILILALVGADGVVTQLESVGPFASYAACNEAGMDARAELPVMRPLGPLKDGTSPLPVWEYVQHRIDWVCVPTAAEPAKAARFEGLEEASRRAAEQTDAELRERERELLRAELRPIIRENRRRFEAGER
jgi:cell division protein FtsN